MILTRSLSQQNKRGKPREAPSRSKFKEANVVPAPAGSTCHNLHPYIFARLGMATVVASAVKTKRGASLAAAYLALGAGMLCISWSAILVRWTDIPGAASAFYRLLIPALVLAPTFLFGKDSLQRSAPLSGKTLAIIAGGGIFFALDLAFYNTAIWRTSAANATLLGNSTPIAVGLLTWLIFGKRPNAAFWIGLLLAIAGSIVIFWGDFTRHVQLGAGDLMAVAAAVFFAGYLMATEKVRKTTSTLAFLRLAIFASTIFLFVLNLALRISLRVPSTRSWIPLMALGLISQLGGYLSLTYAMGRLKATVTSIALLSQVPITALLAAGLLHEPLAGAQIAGGLLVLLGVALALRPAHPEEEANI
jgi:drug/metabolite transporter (DMT)-like permease